MKIHVYAICWNEEHMLPYFLKHYERLAEKIVIFDNHSTDKSQEIIKNHPLAELKFFDTGNESREDVEIYVKGTCWHASRDIADWVISCDMDELIIHKDGIAATKEYLAECKAKSITIPQPQGYQMVHHQWPTTEGQIYDEVKLGFKLDKFSKYAVFDPSKIKKINYKPGCHQAEPEGHVTIQKDHGLRLLHFKLMGEDYLVNRFEKLGKRKSKKDLSRGWGDNYLWKEAKTRNWFKEQSKRAKEVIQAS